MTKKKKLTLEELVREIVTRANRGDDALIATAMLFRELRSRIEAGEAGQGVKWFEWAPQNIGLKKSRLYELQVIANDKNPKEALTRYRSINCERQKRLHDKAIIERDPERLEVITFVRRMPIDHVRKVRQYIAVLEHE